MSEPRAQRRELAGHLARYGLPADTADPLAALRQAEIRSGRQADPRVNEAKMDRAIERATRALEIQPAKQRDLFCFTRLIDAKFSLDADTITHLADRALVRRGRIDELLDTIDRGPPDGHMIWRRPQTPAQLVASLVRYLVLGDGASQQIRITAKIADWLEATLEGIDVPLREAMGGASAFCSNLAASLTNVETAFYSSQPIPRRIAQRFNPGVRLLTPVSDTIAARVNYAAELAGPFFFSIHGRRRLKIDGALRPLEATGRGRMILGTRSTDTPGFALPESQVREIGRSHDLVFVVGPHYFTRASNLDCVTRGEQLARQLNDMKEENRLLLRHYQYVVPKLPRNEADLMAALAGAFDSMSLNSVELAGLLSRLAGHDYTEWNGDPRPPRERAERPRVMLDGALALLQAMHLDRVHVHGLMGSLLIQRDCRDPDRQVLALLKSREVASNKAANASGEIRQRSDLWPVLPLVEGKGLAALESFADAVVEKLELDGEQREQITARWWCGASDDDLTYAFVPNRGIHDVSGGTVSLGDTIDSTALIFGLGE